MQRKNPGFLVKTHDGFPQAPTSPGMDKHAAKQSIKQGAAARSINSTSRAQPLRTPLTVMKKGKSITDPMAILAATRMK